MAVQSSPMPSTSPAEWIWQTDNQHGAGAIVVLSSPRKVSSIVRLTDFWQRMSTAFGERYADSIAYDHVFSQLGGRTVREALAAGVDTKEVWRAVCAGLEVPPALR